MKNIENNRQMPQTSGPLLKSTHGDQREKDTLSANHVAFKQYLISLPIRRNKNLYSLH